MLAIYTRVVNTQSRVDPYGWRMWWWGKLRTLAAYMLRPLGTDSEGPCWCRCVSISFARHVINVGATGTHMSIWACGQRPNDEYLVCGWGTASKCRWLTCKTLLLDPHVHCRFIINHKDQAQVAAALIALNNNSVLHVSHRHLLAALSKYRARCQQLCGEGREHEVMQHGHAMVDPALQRLVAANNYHALTEGEHDALWY